MGSEEKKSFGFCANLALHGWNLWKALINHVNVVYFTCVVDEHQHRIQYALYVFDICDILSI